MDNLNRDSTSGMRAGLPPPRRLKGRWADCISPKSFINCTIPDSPDTNCPIFENFIVLPEV